MILSDHDIKALIESKELVLDPLDESAIQPASIDCRLGTTFLTIDDHAMDIIRMDDEIRYRTIEADEITIPPRSFILATTQEYMKLPANLASFAEGRSSIGRMGLFIQNAGWIDPGFEGKITLELYNANSLPIRLQAGRRVCQLVFAKTESPADHPYKGKYAGQDSTVGSRVFQDSEVSG